MKIGQKMLPLECKQDFYKIIPSDLFLYPTQYLIKLDRDNIKTNTLSKFKEDWTKNVAPRT